MTPSISEDDINSESVCASVSRSTYKMLTTEAQKLGITRAEFVELAIRTASPNHAEWQNTWQRISLINEARKSMVRLKRAISWQHKVKPEDSINHQNDILNDLAKTGLHTQDLSQRLHQMGMTLV